MSKRPLEWHRDCLMNMKSRLAQARLAMERAVANYNRLAGDVAFAEAQIAEAKARGLTAYDSERLLKKRKV